MFSVSSKLKSQTTALSLFFQSGLSIGIGWIMIYNHELFFSKAPIILFAYFTVLMVMNLIEILASQSRSVKQVLPQVLQFVAGGSVIIYFGMNKEQLLGIILIALFGWSILYAISNLINFFQYIREEDASHVRYLISALIHVAFAIVFMKFAYRHLFLSLQLIGIYLIFFGGTLFLDGLSQAVPNRYKNRCQSRFRVSLPVFVTSFVPLTLLYSMDEFYSEEEEPLPLIEKKGDQEPNIEVLVHMGKSLKGIAGHVDIVIDDSILCYGTYDRDNTSLGGGIGAGVMYEIWDKEAYLKFCREVRQETVFEFGFAFTDSELNAIREKLVEIRSRQELWKCKAQVAMEANQEVIETVDMSCKLAVAMDTKFYKFKSGEYKHYWMFGNNCVKFTDELLKASGMKTVVSDIVTPGTYFTFLNDEFIKGKNKIISRTVYYGRMSDE